MNTNLVDDFYGQSPLMSKYQVAYRPMHSALDHLAILQDQIEMANKSGKSLYICFLDYKKFYDKCSRAHMFTALFKLGIRGKTALSLHEIFSNTWNSIRLAPQVYTKPFQQDNGVWQGSSPSTLLASLVFEQFIQIVNQHFKPKSQCHSTPVTAAGDAVNVLAFCDDLVVLSHTWDDLVKGLDLLMEWSPTVHITPHTSKTGKSFILAFGNAPSDGVCYRHCFKGNMIEIVTADHAGINFQIDIDATYEYLGHTFQTNGGNDKHIHGRRKKLFSFIKQIKRAGMNRSNVHPTEMRTMIKSVASAIITHGMHITTPVSKNLCKEYTNLWRTALRKTIGPQVVHGLTNAEIAFDTGKITPFMQNQLIAVRELAVIMHGPPHTLMMRHINAILQAHPCKGKP